MKKRICIQLIFLLFITRCTFTSANAQAFPESSYQQGRYKLNLPDEWLKKPKLVRVITHMIPETLPVSDDMEFCTNCKAGYTVSLFIDSLYYSTGYTSAAVSSSAFPGANYSFQYSFYAGLLLSDSLNKPVSILRINDPSEIYEYTGEAYTRTVPGAGRIENFYDSTGRLEFRQYVQDLQPAVMEIRQPDPGSILTDTFLINICERKIYAINRLLKQLAKLD